MTIDDLNEQAAKQNEELRSFVEWFIQYGFAAGYDPCRSNRDPCRVPPAAPKALMERVLAYDVRDQRCSYVVKEEAEGGTLCANPVEYRSAGGFLCREHASMTGLGYESLPDIL